MEQEESEQNSYEREIIASELEEFQEETIGDETTMSAQEYHFYDENFERH